MSEYAGSFAVMNGSDQTMSGTAKHWTTDYGIATLEFTDLAPGATSSAQPFTTGSGNTDHWSIDVVLADGTEYLVGDKHCDFETEDSSGTVALQVFPQQGTLHISMPSSSDCDADLS